LIVEKILSFLIDNFPSLKSIIIGGPLSLFWTFLCLYFAGFLKKNKGLKTGYTRKIFHFLVFSSAAIIQLIWDISIVCLFGGMATIIIFYSISKGSGFILYEALAREKDEPHRSYYIIIPYFATLLGGLTSNILFGKFAIFGYLVTGFGDAIGEPVGTRFGKHTYRVPSFKGVKTNRSYEGSFAVFIVSMLAITIGIILTSTLGFTLRNIFLIPLLALICMAIEAISPHGWDNTTMQIIPALLSNFFF